MSYSERLAWSELMDDMQVSGTSGALEAAFGRFATRVGFEWFGYIARTPAAIHAQSTYPAGWQQLYTHRDYVEVDPILRQARTDARPFTWDGAELAARRVQRNFFGAAADFSIRAGVTVPIAGSYGEFAALTLAARSNDNVHPAYQENLSYITLAALYFHTHHDRIRAAELAQAGHPAASLTDRERTCLTWIARGKTAQETAAILRVHEATVRYHLNSARRRLGTVSLPQAVAEAMRRREIS